MAVRRNASQWLDLVKHWKCSGETALVFGKKVGVAASALHSWHWRLRKDGLLDKPKTHSPEPPAFIPVRLVSHDREFELARGIDQHVDIVINERNTVRVLPGFDGTTLRRVLDVLRAQETR